jgi:hypothetical protein
MDESNQIAAALPAMADRIAHRIVIAAAQEGKVQRLERIVALNHRRRCGVREVTEEEVLARTRVAVDVVIERLRARRKPATEARVAAVVSAHRNALLVAQSRRTLAEIGETIGPGISETILGEIDQDVEYAYADALQQTQRESARLQRGLGLLIGCGVVALCLGFSGLGATL